MVNLNVLGVMKDYFRPQNIQDVLLALPKPQSPVRDLLFPESRRKQKTSPFISIADIEDVTGAPPVIMRGTHSYSMGGTSQKIGVIEVAPITLSKTVLAAELNNLIALGIVENVKAKMTEIIEYLRDKTTMATELLCCQSLSGKISYPMVAGYGIDANYEVELGSPRVVAPCNIGGKSLGALQVELEAQMIKQQATGNASDVVFIAGSDAYLEFVKIVMDAGVNAPVQWTKSGMVLFGKYAIMAMTTTFSLPGKSTVTPVIEPKFVQTVDIANAGTLFYAALDELDAQLQPLPFFSTYTEERDADGIKVLSSSKPLPALAASRTTLKKYVV